MRAFIIRYVLVSFVFFFSLIYPIRADVIAPILDPVLNEIVTELSEIKHVDNVELLFVGDVMLGRYVEQLTRNNEDYPLEGMREFLNNSEVLIANFEGVVTRNHVPTPSFGMQFSIDKKALNLLGRYGFDILSLANNHSFDFGKDSLDFTRESCLGGGFVCIGNPNSPSIESSKVIVVHNTSIGLLFLNAVSANVDVLEVVEVVKSLNETSEIQIAYIHWGDEYSLAHNAYQQKLAHILIDEGIDAVVGHHPHVIQDVEIYRNAPIFYSLGNFIFDQYFSDEVQVGLTVGMNIQESKLNIYTTVVSSLETHSQPHVASQQIHSKVYDRIFYNYRADERVDVKNGVISLDY